MRDAHIVQTRFNFIIHCGDGIYVYFKLTLHLGYAGVYSRM